MIGIGAGVMLRLLPKVNEAVAMGIVILVLELKGVPATTFATSATI